MTEALERCRALIAPPGSSLYYAVRRLPAAQAQPFLATALLARDINAIVLDCREPAVAQAKLAWWRREVDALFNARPSHPATLALHAALPRLPQARRELDSLLDSVHLDLTFGRYPDPQALAIYLDASGSAAGRLAAATLGVTGAEAIKAGGDWGRALRLVRLMLDTRAHAGQGRVHWPESWFQEIGLSPEHLAQAHDNANTAALFARAHALAAASGEQASAHCPHDDIAALKPLWLWATLAQARMAEVRDDGYRMLSTRVRLTPLRKLWLSWRIHAPVDGRQP